MKVLIKKAKVFSPSSPFHGKYQDILIENGIISEIEMRYIVLRIPRLKLTACSFPADGWIVLQTFVIPARNLKKHLKVAQMQQQRAVLHR